MRRVIIKVVQYLTIILLLLLVGVVSYGCVLRVQELRVEAVKYGESK